MTFRYTYSDFVLSKFGMVILYVFEDRLSVFSPWKYDDGTIVQYDWYGRKSGDAVAQWHNDIGPEFTVKYATTGQKTIKLRVWDNNGESTTTEKTITVTWS